MSEYRKHNAQISHSIEPEEIYRNAVQCNHCKEIIESFHRHDFKFCGCGKVAVDGGKAYRRRLGNIEDYTEVSEVFTKSNGRSE